MTTSKESQAFRLVTIAILAVFMAGILFIIFKDAKNNPHTFKKFSYPEEIDTAKPGDLLQVERVTEDSIYLGFKK